MLLAVDVGNTNIKYALFEGDEIVTSFRVKTDTTKTSDELGLSLINLLKSKGYKPEVINAVIISSVVPYIMHALNNAVLKFFKIPPMIVGPGMKTGIKLVKTAPSEAGTDRIVNGVAALALYGGPVIVVDYGTATKFDLFSADGVFESAVTCPGMMLSAMTLWNGTAALPEVEIKNPGSIICKHTIPSLQAGIFYGKIGEAEYIIKKLKEEYAYDGDIPVVATGGLAKIIFNETDCIQYLEPNLTMYGLKMIYEKNK
ncbi:MAG: type III pantothenate kinase [Lachnospiraceae bacterium]|nr:type III pantothenate kinase [Lachnospiraceae bacterium]